uniref:Uncharacterized protein n=1 Tax=Polysiphonia sp. TaxID=1967842 RepID=A0A1Z1M3M4_9FLOR|nr:hypothetical protein [Polysiphonia sp.]
MSNEITIKYWPNKQSIHLNNAIVELFIETEKKIILKTQNKSSEYLYLDILNIMSRTELLISILNQFKELILDIIEINLNHQKIKKLNKRISSIFINRVSKNFLFKLECNYIKYNKIKNLREKESNFIDYLLTYLIFGSSYIENNIFSFETQYTPYNHVRVLLENFIIQTGNLTMKKLIYNLQNSPNINKFLKQKNICNNLYTSNRSIILFLNNLKWQNFVYSYIYEMKSLYNERQKIWIISSKGIKTKYIYLSKEKRIKNLNQFKTIFILWLEIKDLLIPKTEKLILQIGKYCLYCSINLISNLILILIKIIVFYLKK